ncbi:hypothetical protein Scep_027907 [Stephania cephalantha]|uniref:WD repeat-containing protein 53 n=1 Tax=Stephania cephalantha TaxID=152367 RepID=A0AAP0E8T9_9MAGN
MMKPRRLRGHSRTVTTCVASRDRPGVMATAGEDGCICWFDMRSKDLLFTMDLGKKPISAICFKPGNEDVLFASSGTEVMCFDLHMVSMWRPLETYNYNKEEINQIACNTKKPFLAATDDGGDIKIIDIQQQCLYKTLRIGHTSICSSVQFVPWRPWEVITGGLDSKLILWDFSKGRPCKVMDFGLSEVDSQSNAGQCFNPAFVHALAVPEVDMLDNSGKVCSVARGDGIVDVIDVELELAAVKSKGPVKPQKRLESAAVNKLNAGSAAHADIKEKRIRLDYSLGGHTAAVSCVSFSLFGERGKLIASGGNDASVKLWDYSKYLNPGESSSSSDRSGVLRQNINLNKKVNWLCTTPTDSENLVVCDTSKVVKVYTVA